MSFNQSLCSRRVPISVERLVDGWSEVWCPVFPRKTVILFARILASVEQSFAWVVQLAQEIADGPGSRVTVRPLAGDLKRFQIRRGQARVGQDHLFVMRYLPVSRHRVPEEALVTPVVKTQHHSVEGCRDHVEII